MEEVTVKSRIQHYIDSYVEFTEQEVSMAMEFLCNTAYGLYYYQYEQSPESNWYMIALQYDQNIGYYRVLKWDWTIKDFNSAEDCSNIDEKLIKLIVDMSQSQGMIPITQDQARNAGLIPAKKLYESREERRKREQRESQRVIFLLDFREEGNKENNLQKNAG